MFYGAKKVVVNGGVFVANAEGSPKINLDPIFSNVSRNAILNADGRADEVRCYPGTREEVIGKVEKWMNGEGSRMMWLSGPAGAGKSAICQTVVERCRERGQHEANFFFFRGDGTRISAQHLVATLVYQLRSLYPALDVPLTECLRADPFICSASIKEQFVQLISSPMGTIQQTSSVNQPVVLIIDGLDECDDERKQEQILVALRTVADADHSPFLVLLASRAESHLVMAFNQLGDSVESIFLDEEYRPQNDIRHFVISKFAEIKAAHCLAHTLDKDWLADGDIVAITEKSSGQFIYAATVMRFIQHSPDSPILSLRRILGMQPAIGHSPYTQLDALYSYIFSKARDIGTVKMILGAHFILELWQEHFGALLSLVGYEAIGIESSLVDLRAIVQVTLGPPLQLVFHHASLSDYLKNKLRSGSYHVNTAEIAAVLSPICLKNFYNSYTLDITTLVFEQVEEATEILSRSLLDASAQKLDKNLQHQTCWFVLIGAIRALYIKTDKAMFKIILRHWVRFGYRNGITNLHEVDDNFRNPSDFKYYRHCLTTERVRFALGVSR